MTNHDADPTKAGPSRTPDEVARGVPTIDKSINVEGDGNWIVAHSENATQAQEVDPRLQLEFSVKLGARVPGKGYRFTLTMHGGPEQLNVSVAVWPSSIRKRASPRQPPTTARDSWCATSPATW